MTTLTLSTSLEKLDGNPGSDWHGAEFGGVTVQIDMASRVAEVHVSSPDATPEEIIKAREVLADCGLGFPGQFTASQTDPDVILYSARF